MAGLVASIPSPSRSEVHLGPFPLRGYALCIIVGVVLAVIIGERRFRTMGYAAGIVSDIAIWAVPFGLVGARLYHVITDNQLYFRAGEDHWRAFAIWDGGLGIWGGIALGAVGAMIGCRQYHVRFAHLADACAVGVPVAQAAGRWGNWFNQELYGRPSTLPWALHIDPAHRLPQYANIATYQPTFLYESIWDLGTAGFVLLAERYKWFGRLSAGRAFALYVAVYCVGRGWIEYLRVDEAHRYFGLRLNDYTSLILFLLAVGYMIRIRGREPDRAAVPLDDGEASPVPSELVAADAAPDVVGASAAPAQGLHGAGQEGPIGGGWPPGAVWSDRSAGPLGYDAEPVVVHDAEPLVLEPDPVAVHPIAPPTFAPVDRPSAAEVAAPQAASPQVAMPEVGPADTDPAAIAAPANVAEAVVQQTPVDEPIAADPVPADLVPAETTDADADIEGRAVEAAAEPYLSSSDHLPAAESAAAEPADAEPAGADEITPLEPATSQPVAVEPVAVEPADADIDDQLVEAQAAGPDSSTTDQGPAAEPGGAAVGSTLEPASPEPAALESAALESATVVSATVEPETVARPAETDETSPLERLRRPYAPR